MNIFKSYAPAWKEFRFTGWKKLGGEPPSHHPTYELRDGRWPKGEDAFCQVEKSIETLFFSSGTGFIPRRSSGERSGFAMGLSACKSHC